MKSKFIYSLVLAASLVACTDDYKDWASPLSNPQDEIVAFGNGSVKSVDVIDMTNLEEGVDSVQVCVITAPTASDAAYRPLYTITLGEKTYDLSEDGKIAVADIEDYIFSTFGKRPVEREFAATISSWLQKDGTAVKFASADITIKATPKAPTIETAYYVTGTCNGWDNTDTAYEVTNGGGDVYDNPVFSVTIPVSAFTDKDGKVDIQFKLTPKSGLGGDWSKCIASTDTEGELAYDNAGGNFVVEPVDGAKFYKFVFNMIDLTWNVTALKFENYLFFIGATDGWSGSDQKVALVSDEGLYKGFVYVADPNGWGLDFKFQRVAGSWDNEINSGTFSGGITGDVADDGGNIKVTEGEGVYFMELDMVNNTLKGTKINKVGLIGDFNGWGGDVEMTWNATDYCFEVTNPGVTSNGWKFRFNEDWAINLGGELNNLTFDGANLSAVGNTIKLFPTRKTNNNIFAVVE